MRIGLIAMSGVRVWNKELEALGLTMPGFLDRGKVIASLPSLSLLTLAALTPDDIEVSYIEIADARQASEFPNSFDLVAISTMTAQAPEAYKVARWYESRGTPVVMGGLHATALPDEVLQHCSTVVIGEGEPVWARLIDDFRAGRLARRYKARSDEDFDLAEAPMPRFDLLDVEKYNRLTVQTCRGCPHRCEFCASSIMLTPGYKVKPVAKVIEEIRRIKSIWDRPFIEFADDNSFAMRGHSYELLSALKHENIRWFTEADISIAKDEKLLRLMRESGCRQVLIGLESPDAQGLDSLERRADWKLRQFPKYEEAVRTIQSHGITVIGCFILGLDGHGPEVFDSVYDFVAKTNLYDVQVTVLTPFPGSALYDRLETEGRLLEPGAWDKCTLFDVNFEPSGMSVQQLESGMRDLVRRLYDPEFIRVRREGFFADLDRERMAG